MESISLLFVIVVLFLLLGWTLQFFALAFGAKRLRLPDASFNSAFKVYLILFAIHALLSGLMFILSAFIPDPIVHELLIELTSIFIAVSVVQKFYKTSVGKSVATLAFPFAIGLLSSFAIRSFVVQGFSTPSGSMLPALQVGDGLLASKYAYRFGDPVRGDLAFFINPTNGYTFVARVIGLPGETIAAQDASVLINGQPIADPWGDYSGKVKRRRDFGPFVIPAGEYFVLGDNRDNSHDSRYWGTVPRDNFIGKAMVRYWPASRFATAPF